MKQFEMKIKQALEQFKDGYKKRDVSIVDTYIENLFENHEKTAVLGTSMGEWMPGIAGAKEIVESDWKYWGDVDIDTDNAAIEVLGDTAYVNLRGTVKYVFQYTPEKFESYLGMVKSFFDPSSAEEYNMSPMVKAGRIGFVLTHFNQIRTEGKREAFYPLRINAVMTMQGDRAVFRFMKFSMDYFGEYPELRLDNNMLDMNGYYEQQQGFVDAYMAENRPETKASIETFTELLKKGFNEDFNREELAKLFCTEKEPYIIDPAGKFHRGAAAIDFVEAQRGMWHKLAVDNKAIFSDAVGDTAWVTCNVLVSCNIGQEAAAEKLMEKIQTITNSTLESKDKLFVVQREIANHFLQFAEGGQFVWPVRIAALFMKEEGQWKLFNMSLSYSYYYILEGKYIGADVI